MVLAYTADIRKPAPPANSHRDFAFRALARHGVLSAEEEQAARAGLAKIITVRPSGELIAEGEPLANPRLMLDGWATRHRLLRGGRRQICGFVLPGDVFGLCARRHGVALYSTVALTQVTVAPLPLLAEAMRDTPDSAMGALAWDMVTREETHLVNQVVRLGRQSALERLVHLLLEFHDRLGRVGLVENDRFRMPFTQEVLADTLGLSVVHTNRMLQQLRRERLIVTSGGHICLHDLAQLARIADYNTEPA